MFLFEGFAANFDDEVQQIVRPVAIVDANDVIGVVIRGPPFVGVRNAEAEILVLDVRFHFGQGIAIFERLREVRFPFAVVRHEVNVTLIRTRLVASLQRVERDDARRAERIVRLQHGPYFGFPARFRADRTENLLGRPVPVRGQPQELREHVIDHRTTSPVARVGSPPTVWLAVSAPPWPMA